MADGAFTGHGFMERYIFLTATEPFQNIGSFQFSGFLGQMTLVGGMRVFLEILYKAMLLWVPVDIPHQAAKILLLI